MTSLLLRLAMVFAAVAPQVNAVSTRADSGSPEKFYVVILPPEAEGNVSAIGKPSTVQTVLDFAWNRIPNGVELLIDVLMQTVVEGVFWSTGVKLPKNSASKLVYRDTSKAFSGGVKLVLGTEIGGTGRPFDEGNFYSPFAKTGIKLPLISVLQLYMSPNLAGAIANLPGDAVARSLVIAGMERQDVNSTLPFHEFCYVHYDDNWLIDGVKEATPKVALSFGIGALVEMLGFRSFVERFFYGRLAGVLGMGTGALGTAAGFAANRQALMTHRAFSAMRAGGAVLGVEALVIFVDQVFNSYVQTPIARLTQDGIRALNKGVDTAKPKSDGRPVGKTEL